MLDIRQLTGKQQQFIQLLQAQPKVASLYTYCEANGLDFNFIKGFLLSGALDGLVEWTELQEQAWILTEKGKSLNGEIPALSLVEKLRRGVLEVETLQTLMGYEFSIAFGALRRERAVEMGMQDQTRIIEVLKPEVLDSYRDRQLAFQAIAEGRPLDHNSHLEWLSQQGWIVLAVTVDYQISGLPALQALDVKPLVTTLTSELLLSGQWKKVALKPYNIHDAVSNVPYGRPTILTQCIQQIRDIFLNMGFDEMSGYIIETAFWNFDVLFTPQDHPAREVQDTFYLSQPQTLPLPSDKALVEHVKRIHEQSYSGQWTEEEASYAILRAHTTSSTARQLYNLQGRTGKYFSIDKVFRNETVDRTHLAEFHQIEGVVIGELLSVRTLMGYLTYFYEHLGFKDLKFKPTYNPYTEPSLEVYAYHPPSQKYLEVGNSGLFRPEMLEPLGCGGKSTIAWGLGLERIAMLLYGVEKLSDLVGPDIRLAPA